MKSKDKWWTPLFQFRIPHILNCLILKHFVKWLVYWESLSISRMRREENWVNYIFKIYFSLNWSKNFSTDKVGIFSKRAQQFRQGKQKNQGFWDKSQQFYRDKSNLSETYPYLQCWMRNKIILWNREHWHFWFKWWRQWQSWKYNPRYRGCEWHLSATSETHTSQSD